MDGQPSGMSWSCLGQNESRTTIISLSICLFQAGRKKEALRNWSSNHKATILLSIFNLTMNSMTMLAHVLSTILLGSELLTMLLG